MLHIWSDHIFFLKAFHSLQKEKKNHSSFFQGSPQFYNFSIGKKMKKESLEMFISFISGPPYLYNSTELKFLIRGIHYLWWEQGQTKSPRGFL